MGLQDISVPPLGLDTDDQRASLSQSLSPPAPPPLVLRVALRPLRVFALTVLAVVSISVLIVFFHLGHEVKRFKSSAFNSAQQTELLDKYNSYAGNIGTAFGKPIELFVTAAVQVLMLRFLASHMLKQEPGRHVVLLSLALTTGVGYLLNSGFGALNVQVRERNIQPAILISDLTFEFNATALQYANATTSVDLSIPETSPLNPVANTVLRSLVLPRKGKPLPKCDWTNTQADFKDHIADDVLEFGMPQRDWMEKLLPEALDAQRLRVVINASDANANKNVSANDLPMNASRAANLLVHSLFLSSQYLPWGKSKVWETLPPNNVTDTERNVSTALLMGLLPPLNQSQGETQQREWLLKETGPLLSRLFEGGTINMSTSDITMEFSSTPLAPHVTFDAVTFEVDVDPKLYATSTDQKNRLLKLDPYQCSPWPGRCLIEKKGSPPLAGLLAKSLYDAPMQVHAFAMCVDDTGAEMLESAVGNTNTLRDFNVRACAATSNSSLLLVSVGKRLVADALVEKVRSNASGEVLETPVATNVRKIYTFTVGRLGWSVQNLSEAFHAACETDDGSDCMGLSFPLADRANQLVVGKDTLPLNLLTPVFFGDRVKQRPTPLVQITEPSREADSFQYNVVAGDILYPHNIKNLQWSPTRTEVGTSCSAIQEDRVRRVLDNHLYMETTRQATYTAAMFFLFQNAVVREIIFVQEDDGQTLAFDGNVQDMALWVSTPLQNMVQTLVGCAVLALGLLSGLFWSLYGRATNRLDPLANITAPHVIARAMLDESQFPSLLLHRRIMDNTSDQGIAQRKLAAFEIQSLLLQHQKDSDDCITASV